MYIDDLDGFQKFVDQVVNNYPLLTAEDEVELSRRISEGDEKARERFLLSNIRLVLKIIDRYRIYDVPTQDLFSVGFEGLDKAVRKFDRTMGNRFSTMAVSWIQDSISRWIMANKSTIKIPLQKQKDLNRAMKALEANKANPNDGDGHIDLCDEDIQKLLSVKKTIISSDIPYDGAKSALINTVAYSDFSDDVNGFLSPELALENSGENQKRFFEKVTSGLNSNEKKVINFRYGFSNDKVLTLEQTSKVVGVSKERVRQIQARALNKMKDALENRPDIIEGHHALRTHG